MKRVLLPVLMVVGLATVAWAQLTYRMEGNLVVRDQFSVTDDGPHGIGIAPESGSGLRIATKGQASGGLASAVRIDGTALAVSNGDILALLNVGSSGVIDVIGVNPTQASAVRLSGSTLTKSGAGTIPTAATLVIEDAPTIGTTNYVMWVKGGTVQLAGPLNVTGAATFSSTVKSTGQPGFFAYNSSSQSCLTGCGTTVVFDAEIFDNATNFASNTFTAPITGQYHFCAAVSSSEASAAKLTLRLVTSNYTYRGVELTKGTAGATDTISFCTYAEMDASDTALVELAGTIGETITINGLTGSTQRTYFSGRLVP